MEGEGFDATRSEEINAMPYGADLANELCLIEYEYHAFADSEGTAGFCCQAFMQDVSAFSTGWSLEYHFLVNTETLEDSTAVFTVTEDLYGGEDDVAFGASWIAVEETPEPEEEEEDDEEEEAARAKGAVTLASLAALLAIFTQ